MAFEMPLITITLSGMRQKISHAFADHCEELEKYVDEVMEEMMKPENLRRILKEQMANELCAGLDGAIKAAIHEALWNIEWRGELAKIVGERLLKVAETKSAKPETPSGDNPHG